MNEQSSNSTGMINGLEHIKKVKVRESLFEEIKLKISNQKVIPLFKVRAAAAVFLCLVSFEFFIGIQNQQDLAASEVEALVPNISNSLYHD